MFQNDDSLNLRRACRRFLGLQEHIGSAMADFIVQNHGSRELAEMHVAGCGIVTLRLLVRDVRQVGQGKGSEYED